MFKGIVLSNSVAFVAWNFFFVKKEKTKKPNRTAIPHHTDTKYEGKKERLFNPMEHTLS
jgi:hypothetical protein